MLSSSNSSSSSSLIVGYISATNSFLIDYSNKDSFDLIKKGYLSKSIYNKALNKLLLNSEKTIASNNNLSYRNLMILPNDNGIIKINFKKHWELNNVCKDSTIWS